MTSKRDPSVTSKIMRAIRSKGTKVEVTFAKALRSHGVRYKKYYNIKGRPDFVSLKNRVAIFIDGDFWHGNGWRLRGFKKLEDSIRRNKKFWINKIKTNIARDKLVNKILRKQGWRVIRLWESDIKKDKNKCVLKLLRRLEER